MPTFYNLSQSSAAKQVFLTAGVGTVGCEDVARVSMSVCVCARTAVFLCNLVLQTVVLPLICEGS